MQSAARRRICARVSALCASATLTLGVACSAPTTETGVWKSPTYAAGPMTSVAVFAGRLSGRERRQLEDAYVAALATHGVHATPSYVLFPDGGSQARPDPNAVRSTLQRDGYDGVLFSTMRGATEHVLTEPGNDWPQAFSGAYYAEQAPMPTEVQVESVVHFQTTVWSTRTGQMVWSATTQTKNPTSGSDFVASLTKAVVPSLAQAGLIPSGQARSVSMSMPP